MILSEDTWAQNDKHVPSLVGSSFEFDTCVFMRKGVCGQQRHGQGIRTHVTLKQKVEHGDRKA